MKKYLLYSSILALALTGSVSFTSCESQLDIEQKGATWEDQFYKTDADAEAALVAAYEGFMCNVVGRQPDFQGSMGIYTPHKLILNMCGDDVYYASGNYGDHEDAGCLNEFRYDTDALVPKLMYSGLYSSVYTCNLVIDKFANPDTPVKKRCVAEARVLRAYDYFLLANFWGTPPFVLHPLSAQDLPFNSDKDPEHPMTHEQLIEWVASECEEAAADLDERKSKDDKDGAVKVTKGFANALAGKAYLFAGKYEQAKTALKKVIDSGKYALVPGDKYMDNFHIEGDGDEEKVFEINFEYNAGKGAWGGMIQQIGRAHV